MSGWIKLHRSLIDWEWYDDKNATRLLIHLLISVNHEPKRWKGVTIPAGSMALSWESLSENCKLSVKQCRVAMSKLEESGEVARTRTNKYQVVSLVKWEKLQSNEVTEGRQKDRQRADKGQTKGRQRATTKEVKNSKKYKKEEYYPPISPQGNLDLYDDKQFLDSWEGYIEMRLGKKKQPTERAARLTASKLLEYSNGNMKKAIEILDRSTENGWTSVFPLKSQSQGDEMDNVTF